VKIKKGLRTFRGGEWKPRKQRKNSAAGTDLVLDAISSMAGDALINAALRGCSLEEKVALAALLPEMIASIRKAFPEGLPKRLLVGRSEPDGSPDSTEAKP
jgi:hypothetical protein